MGDSLNINNVSKEHFSSLKFDCKEKIINQFSINTKNDEFSFYKNIYNKKKSKFDFGQIYETQDKNKQEFLFDYE